MPQKKQKLCLLSIERKKDIILQIEVIHLIIEHQKGTRELSAQYKF